VGVLVGNLQPVTAYGWLWLIPLLPLLGALVNGLVGKRLQDRIGVRAVHVVAVGATLLSAAAALAAVGRMLELPPAERFLLDRLWILVDLDIVRVDLALALDPLSAVMVLVITLVGTLIHVYAAGYMDQDESPWRFFAYLNLFVFSMLLLVLADSLLLLFFGWEGVGLCSYLLIGYWYRDASNAAAGRKAFLANRVGDWGFLVGLFLLFWGMAGTFTPPEQRLDPALGPGQVVEVEVRAKPVAQQMPARTGPAPVQTVRLGPTLSVRELRDQLALETELGNRPVTSQLEHARLWGVPLLLLLGFAFFLGMSGKSAQIPLYVWLPDAMAGPTPVSALIHAATMVTAGVYLAVRLSFLFALTPEAMTVVATAGLLTALLGALLAVFQHDLKRVLAYSTISQLGFMFLAVGVGAFGAGIFHLVTHACFKACLFLAAGSAIRGMHFLTGPRAAAAPDNDELDARLRPDPRDPQDLRNMGGLGRLMPRTRLGYLLGALALAGLPIAAGFYSKDEILWRAFTQQNVLVSGRILFTVGVATAGLTAFYVFRSYYLVFHGRPQPPEAAHQVHESPASMTLPLLLLGAAAVLSGPVLGWPEPWGGHPLLERFLEAVLAPASELTRFQSTPRSWPYLLQAAGVLAALVGWALARELYQDLARSGARLQAWRVRADRLHRILWNKLYLDELYRALFVRSVEGLSRAATWIDRRLIDGLVGAVGRVATVLARAGGWLDGVVVDGAVNGIAALTLAGGRRLQRLQTGRINHYVVGIAVGAALLVVLSWVLGCTPAHAQSAVGARATLSERALSFSRDGETRRLVIRNTGDVPLQIGSMRIVHDSTRPVDFVVKPIGPHAIVPGQSLTLTVSYRPRIALGEQGQPRQAFAALQLVTNDPRLPVDHDAGGRVAGVALRAGEQTRLLSLIVFFPLLGIPLFFLVPAGREALARWIALLVTAVPLALSVRLLDAFDRTAGHHTGNWGLQFVERVPWIRGFYVEYFLGVDGLSVTMVLLTTLVTVIAVGASWSLSLDRHIRAYFALLCLLEVGMTGVFVALDFFLFFVFWEVMLLPMYFLIGLWGGARKEYAAIKFVLYTLAGSVLMLLAIIALYYASGPTTLVDGTPAAHTFNLMKLAHANDFGGQAPILGFAFAKLIWMLLFVAFAIKIPSVPFHTWLPDAHVEAPTAISVVLAGILLKMGVYGLLRVNWAVLPEATRWAADAVAWIGVASILWGALCAMSQKDLKRLVAYSSVSHMGFCLLGMASLTVTGTSGAVVQMFNHGTITSMLFLLVGVLSDRTHSRGLDEFGGVARLMPRYAAVFGLAFMASLGLPGLSGFIGEVLVFLGAFPVHTALTVVAALSLVITAAYHLTAIQKIQLGSFNERWRSALAGRDLDLREAATLLPLAVLVIVLGFWPLPLIATISQGIEDLVRAVAAPGVLAP
jgi:proton-translocating NADH-quinone oxidoreductase chain M